jgi:hypothetical protein
MQGDPQKFSIRIADIALIIIAIFVVLAYFTGWNN